MTIPRNDHVTRETAPRAVQGTATRGWRRVAVAATLLALAGGAMATEYGRVLSSTPVMQSVPTSQQVCRDEAQWAQPRSSGGGALLGALVGGVIGNAFGSGGGRALATGAGLMAGAVIGDRAEMQNRPGGVETVRRCDQVGGMVDQVVGYDVVYEYNGQRRSTRVDRDPGAWLALDVNVAPAGQWQPVPPAPGYASGYPQSPAYAPAPADYAPLPAYVAAPVYAPPPPVYGPPPRRWREPVVQVAPVVSIGYEWNSHRPWR